MDNNQNPLPRISSCSLASDNPTLLRTWPAAERLQLLQEIVSELQYRRWLDFQAVQRAENAPLDPVEDVDTSSESLSDWSSLVVAVRLLRWRIFNHSLMAVMTMAILRDGVSWVALNPYGEVMLRMRMMNRQAVQCGYQCITTKLGWHIATVSLGRVGIELRRETCQGARCLGKNFWQCSDPFQLNWKKPRLSPPVFGMQSALTAPVEGPTSSSASSSTTHVSDFAKRRLHIARLIRTDDHARWEALRKLKMLILLNPSSSELGRTLVASATLLRSDDQLGSSIIDSFSAKATGTLVKRAGALWRYAKYCATHNIQDPLSSSESDVYAYMQHLKVHGAATSANDFLQAWRFFHHAVGLKCCPVDELISARVRGAADGMFSAKRKLNQAVPYHQDGAGIGENCTSGPLPSLAFDRRPSFVVLGK